MEKIDRIKCSQCKSKFLNLFNDEGNDLIEKIESIQSCKKYHKGEQIFTEGTNPKGLYCIHSGKVKISQLGLDGKEQILHMQNEGDIMGHRAIFAEDSFACSATALEDSYVCLLPKLAFQKLSLENPKILLRITQLLAKELKIADDMITSTAQQPVRERIALSLLFLKNNYGYEADLSTLKIILKREELANLAGTTRETATRELYKLQDQNVIKLNKKKIQILNEKMLRSFLH